MYYFIVNPRSRTGHGQKIWAKIQSLLCERQIPHTAYLTQYAGHARQLAQALTSDLTQTRRLIALGGDGTLSEVLSGIQDFQNVLFSYIPTGSGNDFARGMGMSTDPLANFNLLSSPHRTSPMDVGAITVQGRTHRFGVSVGMGYDAAICHEALYSPVKAFLNRLHLGKLTYLLIAVKQLVLCTPTDLEISADGQPSRLFPRAYFATVMNQRYEGGGISFCPLASPWDGHLDVCVISGVRKGKFLFLLLMSLLKKHTKFSGVHIFRCKSIRIKSSAFLPVHRDGESNGIQNEIFVKLEKEPLNVTLPMI